MQNALLGRLTRIERVSQASDYSRFMALVELHGAAVMAMLRRLCGNPHDAEDAFQETAIRVWKNFASRPRLRNPRGWLMTIAYRAFLDQRAKRPRHEGLEDPPDAGAGTPQQAAEQSETRNRLEVAIAGLDEPIREVVVLHYVGGMSLRQTADVMGIADGTAKSRLNTALVKLRRTLE